MTFEYGIKCIHAPINGGNGFRVEEAVLRFVVLATNNTFKACAVGPKGAAGLVMKSFGG